MNLLTHLTKTAIIDFRDCKKCKKRVYDDDKSCVRYMCKECRKKAKKFIKSTFSKDNILYTLKFEMKEYYNELATEHMYCLEWSGSGNGDLPLFYLGTKRSVLYHMIITGHVDYWFDDIADSMRDVVADTYKDLILGWEDCLERVDFVKC